MNDRRGDEHGGEGPRHRDDRGGRGGPDRDDRGRDGPDTRFLQLEMSQVMYAEAQGVTKQAFRELLLDAAKTRLRERFGATITRLAELATDEALADMEASLDIEDQIRRRQESQESKGSTPDRLREALARHRADRSERSAERREGRATGSRRRRR
jgi:hypothetical protein